jgi:3-phenylpropionate/cinnamic acid dioxygenase small subunit
MAAEGVDGLAALERRLATLEAERDIQQLMVKYAESLDYGDENAWADTYTAEGGFDVRRQGEAMFAHSGTAALAAFATGHTSAPAVYHKHFLSIPNITLDLDAGTATAKTYFTMLHESPNGPIVLVFGRYLDELVRTDGGWRFSNRVVDMEAMPSAAAAAN